MLGLDSKRKQAEAGTAALDMLGANYRGYAETPQYLRNPEYDPVSASMEQAMSSGNMGAALAIRDFMASRQPQFEFHEGPGGVVGWSYGKQAGVSMPKAASSGAEGSEYPYKSSIGKALYDAEMFKKNGMPEYAMMIQDSIISNISMDDGYNDLDLIILKNSEEPKDKEEYRRIMKEREKRKLGLQYYFGLGNGLQPNTPQTSSADVQTGTPQADLPLTDAAGNRMREAIKNRR